MEKEKETRLDFEKLTNPALIRLNLMMASLYVLAFELLMISVVEGVRDVFFHIYPRPDKQQLKKWGVEQAEYHDKYGTDLTPFPYAAYQRMAACYESEIGKKADTPDNYAFIPSCLWLQKKAVYTADDISLIRELRNHRHEIAHGLHLFILSEGIEIEVEKFNQIRELLRKVEIFWYRSDILFDPITWEEIDTIGISIDEVFSAREVLLQVIIDAVADYANQYASNS